MTCAWNTETAKRKKRKSYKKMNREMYIIAVIKGKENFKMSTALPTWSKLTQMKLVPGAMRMYLTLLLQFVILFIYLFHPIT